MKICILGSSGTGKTTLCRKLGERYQLPILHLDSIYWKKNWDNISKSEFDSYMKQYLVKHKSWVIDGNYSNNLHFRYRLDAADIIIFLDYGTNQSLKGIFQRANRYKHQTRSDMAEGCIEGVDQVFLKYVANYDKFRSKYLKAIINQYKNKKQVMIFKNRQELNEWFNAL